MPFFLETENGKNPFSVGDTLKLNYVAGIPIRWELHVEGDDRRVGDSFAIESHHDLFVEPLFTANRIDGDDPLVFNLSTKTGGFPVGTHRFPIVKTLKTICVIEVNAVARPPIEVPLPVEDPPAAPRRRREPPADEIKEDNKTKSKELGPWTKFGVRSLYGVMFLFLLCSLACGGFTLWTSGKLVNLFTDWAGMSLKTAASDEQPEALPPEAPDDQIPDPNPTPLDARPILQPQ